MGAPVAAGAAAAAAAAAAGGGAAVAAIAAAVTGASGVAALVPQLLQRELLALPLAPLLLLLLSTQGLLLASQPLSHMMSTDALTLTLTTASLLCCPCCRRLPHQDGAAQQGVHVDRQLPHHRLLLEPRGAAL